ncbi:MAG: type II secretion system secretin GspD [Polyangiaceae bacterium]
MMKSNRLAPALFAVLCLGAPLVRAQTPAPAASSDTPLVRPDRTRRNNRLPAAGAATPSAAPSAGTTPPGGTAGSGAGTAGTTGTGASGASGTGGAGTKAAPTVLPNGKAQADTTGLAQFENGMEFEPRSPNQKVALSLEDADLPDIVRTIAQLTGKRFIFGGKVRNIKATVYSPEKVTVAEAYQAFLSILEANGLTVVPQGRFLKIIDTAGAANQTTPTYTPGQAVPAEDRYVTRMHRLAHGSADEASAVLQKFKSKDADISVVSSSNMIIMTDTGNNIRRMMRILEQIDVGSAGDQIWIEPVHYAAASDIATRVNDLFDIKGSSGSGGGKGAAGGGGGGGGGGSGAGDLHVAKVIADDRSNSLVIVSTEKAYLRVLEFIKKVDIPQTGEGEIHVLPLQHADAVKLTKTLNEIVGNASAAPAGGGAGRRGAGAAAAPTNEAVFEGTVRISADESTNSIVVTSSLRDYASLRSVVDRLDQSRKQVFIDAAIMDLSITRATSLGVSWHGGVPVTSENGTTLFLGGLNAEKTVGIPGGTDLLQGAAVGVRGPDIPNTTNLIPGVGLSVPAFGAAVAALANSTDTDVLSTPHILATDNVLAEINIGENIAIQQTNTGLAGLGGLTGAAGGAAGAAGLAGLGALGGFGGAAPRQDVGTKISIKPHINESNDVRLEVSEEISEARAPEGAAQIVPITKRTAKTELVVKDQQTVVIGGLMRNRVAHSQKKIPVLGDIPLLGVLFRQSQDSMQKTNLVLVLTPYVIREQSDLRNVFERKMQERQEFLDHYFVFADSAYEPPKDYSRTNGLVEEIRQSYLQVEEKKKLDELTRPKELKGHPPQTPLEMPSGPRMNSGGGGGGDNPPPAPPSTPPRVNVNPMQRNIERIER